MYDDIYLIKMNLIIHHFFGDKKQLLNVSLFKIYPSVTAECGCVQWLEGLHDGLYQLIIQG